MSDFDPIITGVGSTQISNAGLSIEGQLSTNGGDVVTDGGGVELAAVNSYVTVDAGAPTTYITPLYYDSTAVTGGLYAWDGSAYQQVGNLVT